MVKWLERLDHDAESLKGLEFEAGLRHPTTGKLCQPSSEWVPFLELGKAVPKIQLDSNPHCPYGY